MAGETRRPAGFPTNNVKGDDWSFNPGCGGSGAGSCVLPAGFSYIYWPIKVNPFSVRNTLLVLHNDDFLAYTNGGNDGLCPNSDGARIEFDIYLLHQAPTSSLNPALATAKITVPTSTMLPMEFEFPEGMLPQPIDPLYERRIWVAIDLRATGRMIGGRPQVTEAMKTVKLDWEGTP